MVNNTRPWMSKLAWQYDMDVDTIKTFYESIESEYKDKRYARQRTRMFFELYLKGVKGE